MNSNEMQLIWNSPLNNLTRGQQERLADHFIHQMNRRRRFQSIWLINIFVWLAIITVIAVWTVAAGNTQLTQEWALIPLLIVPWALAVYFLRSYLKSRVPLSPDELPIIESLRAALTSNFNQQSRLKIVGGLYFILIPIIVLAMRQLQTVGKGSEHQLASMAVLFAGALLVSALAMTALFFGRLVPQQRKLEGLLAEAAD